MTIRLAVPLELDPRAFAGIDRAAPVVDLAGETMGTVWRVRLAVPQHCDLPGLRVAIAARLAVLVAEMSHWEADSILSRFNRAAGGAWMSLPPDFAAVMATALDIAERTHGAFDPAIGSLVNLWGFGPEPHARVPSEPEIAAALALSGWRRLAFDAAARRLRQPGGLALDLSGIAKGYAVDAVARLLAAQGIAHALVEIGGECVGIGVRPDFDPWWVDLETPPGVAVPPLRVALHHSAVATSGDYVRGAHTIDPRSGRPVHTAMSVSVLHRSAMHADAWASALTVLEPGEAAVLAGREGLAVRAIIRTADGVAEWLSPKLRAMLES